MKRKSVLLLTSALLAAMVLGGCGKKEEEDASILDDIKEETVEMEIEEETEETEEEVGEEENHDGMYRSELTNEWNLWTLTTFLRTDCSMTTETGSALRKSSVSGRWTACFSLTGISGRNTRWRGWRRS